MSAFSPKIPVTPFLDKNTGMPTTAWHQYLASLGATKSTVATASPSTTGNPVSVPTTTESATVPAFPPLDAPLFVALSPGSVIPKFRIRCPIPATGTATKLDVYYQVATQQSTLSGNGWIHYGSVGSLDGTPFESLSLVDVEILNPQPTPAGKQYFAAFALSNSAGAQASSPISDGLTWPPAGQYLIDPENPILCASLDKSGNVTKIRVTANFPPTMETLPDGLAVMYSATDVPNAVSIASGNTGSDLVIDGTFIEAKGTGVLLAGSTVGELVNTTLTNPNNTNFPLLSKYWVQYGTSQWRKATGVTATSFLFDPPFDVTPVTGETTNWAEIAWFDDRGPDSADTYGVPGESYRLGCLVSGTQYEVLSWTSVYQDGLEKFHIAGCVRGLEGTVPISADGLTMHYYPAPGAGTVIITIPALNFTKSTNGTWIGQAESNISVPAGWSVSLSCCTFKTVLGKIIRSDIVPLAYGGTY